MLSGSSALRVALPVTVTDWNHVSLFTMSFPVTILYACTMSAWWRLSSSVRRPTSFSLSSYVFPSSPEIIFTALFCTFSRTSLSPSCQGDHAGTANSRCGLTYWTYSRTKTCLSLKWRARDSCDSTVWGTPTKRQVTKRQVSKRPVSKRLKRQVYKTSGLQNVRFTKRQVVKTSGLQNVRLQKKHPYIFCTCGWWKSAGFVAAMFAGCVLNCKYVYFILTFTFPFTKAYTHGVDRYSGRNHLRWRIIYISING